MRHHHVRAAALGLALGLGAAGLALGDDAPARGNWLTRLFVAGPAAKKDDEPANDEKAPSALPPRLLRAQAKDDLLRRLEVCDRLREIAFQNGDDELRRKADQLDQRAWDAYAQQMARLSGGGLDEAVLDGKLGPAAVGRRSPLTAAPRDKTDEGRAAAGEQR